MRKQEVGKLIVLHGVNRTGKTTQSKLLVERIKKYKQRAIFIKYPIYDLPPTGPWIYDYFRKGNPYQFSPREMQLLNVINRRDSNVKLIRHLLDRTHVIAESYASGGIVWGMAENIDQEFLEQLNVNNCVQKPDLEILLDGDPFSTGKEVGHIHEEKDELQKNARNIYFKYAQKHKWPIIDVQVLHGEEEIHEEVWSIVRPHIL